MNIYSVSYIFTLLVEEESCHVFPSQPPPLYEYLKSSMQLYSINIHYSKGVFATTGTGVVGIQHYAAGVLCGFAGLSLPRGVTVPTANLLSPPQGSLMLHQHTHS